MDKKGERSSSKNQDLFPHTLSQSQGYLLQGTYLLILQVLQERLGLLNTYILLDTYFLEGYHS
jgi:hypothetical protein